MQHCGFSMVFRLKLKQNGDVERHKARLVPNGFNQTYGVDYFDTFSLIVKPARIRVIISLVVFFCWTILQLDVSNAS